MSIRLDLEKRLTPYEQDGEPMGHCVDATPAGAVLVAIGPADTPPVGSDGEAFAAGMITIMPLRFDLTADPMLDELASWELDRLLGERPQG